MGFTVLDSNGQVKIIAGSTGVILTDPLGPTHGGTGLTTLNKGGILYASAANVLSQRVPDTDFDVYVPKTLSNILYPGETAATDPRLGSVPRWVASNFFAGGGGGGAPQTGAFTTGLGEPKPSFAQAFVSTGQFTTSWSQASAGSHSGGVSTGAATTFVQDATSTWERFTTSGTGGIGWLTNFCTRAEWFPFIEVKFRTGSVITGIRIWFVLTSSGSLISGADDQSTLKGVGLRYSTGGGDTAWTPWSANGVSQTLGTAVGSVVASTVYTASMVIANGIATFIVTPSGGTPVTTSIAAPQEMYGSQNPAAQLALSNSSGAGTRDIDVTSVFITNETSFTP